MVTHSDIRISTQSRCQWIDISPKVSQAISASGIREGICCVSSLHTTAGITVNENADPDVGTDFFSKLSELIPRSKAFRHSEGNSDSHVKTSLVGPAVLAGCVASVCFFYAISQAQTTTVRYAAELNQVPSSCRVAAMGDAGVALPLDAAGVFWNPASHAFVNQYEISAEYAKLYGGLSSHGCAALHVPLQEQMSVDAFYARYQSGAIKEWDTLQSTELERLQDPSKRADDSYNGLFYNDQNLAVVSLAKVFPMPIPRPASYSYPMPVDLSVGVSFKDFWQTMNPGGKVYLGMNINCDAGLLLRVAIDYDLSKKEVDREVYVGVTAKDFLGTSVVWLNSPENYQESVDGTQYYGISYIDKTRFLGANWLVSFALEKSYDVTYHGGIEAEFFDMVFLRAGLSGDVWTCGAGVTYRNYSLDYALRFDDIDFSPLRLALRVSF